MDSRVMLAIELDSSRAMLTRSSGLIFRNRLFRRDGGALYSMLRSWSSPCGREELGGALIKMRGQRLGIVGIRTGLCSSRFSQHGSTLSHLDNNLLHVHMMTPTMNR